MTAIKGVYISEVKKTLVKNSLSVSKALNERGTAEFALFDLGGTESFVKGQPVAIYDDEEQLAFAGVIEDSEPVRMGVRGSLIHQIRCTDFCYLADKRIVSAAYESKTAGYIADKIFDDYLAAEDVTIGGIETGPTIHQAVFNYIRASEALNQLAEKSNMVWMINDLREFYFIAKTTEVAPWKLTGYDILKGSLIVNHGNALYRNRQYIRGPLVDTDLQAEIHLGTGDTLSFTLGYPCSKEPTITLGGAPQTVGIKGLEIGKDWYWSKGDETIVATVAPGAAVAIAISYYGQYALIFRSDSPAEILTRIAIEGGGTGFVDEITDDTDLTSNAAAAELAAAKLQQYGQIGTTISFVTLKTGLAVGQTLTVNYPERTLEMDMLITAIECRLVDRQWHYHVKAAEYTLATGWTAYFGKLGLLDRRLAIDRITVGEGSALTILVTTPESWTWAELVVETIFVCPVPAVNLWPTVVLYPC